MSLAEAHSSFSERLSHQHPVWVAVVAYDSRSRKRNLREIILDIGANHGDFALAVAAARPDITVVAVEPISELCAHIQARSLELGVENLVVVEAAIDEVPRAAVINVSRHADWGVSSLLPFDNRAVSDNPYWRGRRDLYYDEERRTDVRRLDDVLASFGDCAIVFAKVDTQGLDLRVLKSLGARLATLGAGMMEASTTVRTRLYDGEIDDLACTLNWLSANDFDVYAIKPNDPACNEVNIFFHRRGTDWEKMEDDLRVKGIPIYDGKHFWHMPSSELQHPEAMIGEINAEKRRLAEIVDERDKKISELAQQMGVERAKFSDLTSQHNDLASQYNQVNREKDFLQGELQAVHKSLIWRWTGPLRSLNSFWKRR